jgi:hypothetical protein
MKYLSIPRSRTAVARCLVALVGLVVGSAAVWAIVTDLTLVGTLHTPVAEHIDQHELLALVQNGRHQEAFEEAFEHGDEFFETEFNALDGGGANVGDGSRYTRVPRADLSGGGAWASHVPERATGPNATACNSCHIQLFDDGAGSPVANVHRDTRHSGQIGMFIQRNTPHLFSPGALQRLAEEMTTTLWEARDAARQRACRFGASGPSPLEAKGVSFGSIAAVRAGNAPQSRPCEVRYDTSRVEGIDADLVVRPFQWKGSVAFLRDFNRGAAHNEIGIQPVETTGDHVDGDGDGVADEATIGDMTALAIYLAAQPRPTSKLELASLGLIEPLDGAEVFAIRRGARVFRDTGCVSCHRPSLLIDDPIFHEPSRHAAYRDAVFPAGQDPVSLGVIPRFPVSFDLTRDQPDNQIHDDNGQLVFRLGSFRKDASGRAMVGLFGDLKRHVMGNRLAEAIDEVGTGPATFLTENLWGVGSSAPYLHDGRATTLTEAILEHGGEGAAAREAFRSGSPQDQAALVAFLDNLVLFKLEDEEVVVAPPPSVELKPTLRRRLHHRRTR